jgi:hypothetical protein
MQFREVEKNGTDISLLHNLIAQIKNRIAAHDSSFTLNYCHVPNSFRLRMKHWFSWQDLDSVLRALYVPTFSGLGFLGDPIRKTPPLQVVLARERENLRYRKACISRGFHPVDFCADNRT